MQQEKFKVIDFIRELIVYMDANLQNFPRKKVEIKTKLKKGRNLIIGLLFL